jgi:hypothetical protein
MKQIINRIIKFFIKFFKDQDEGARNYDGIRFP